MKRTAAILVTIGIGLLMTRFVMGKGIIMMNGLNEKKVYVCKNEVKSIHIKELTGEIIVKKDNVDHAKISYVEREDGQDYEIVESGGKLSIVRKERVHLLDFDSLKRSMTVTIPDDLEGEMKISNKSGSIRISSLSLKEADIVNVTGNIMLEDVISEGDLTVDNTSGSVTLDDVTADGDIEVNNTTGRIKVENLKSRGDIILKAVTGSVSGTIAGKKSEYGISTKVVTGSSNLSNTEQGNKKLKVSTKTGSIKLSFLE